MYNVSEFQFFLFDFDGLLVNTEAMHFKAYQEMCLKHGYKLDISFLEYYRIAGVDAEAPKRMVYGHFPKLYEEEPDWSVLYKEKKQIFLELLEEVTVELLPGVFEFLKKLERLKKPSCCVTHSMRAMIDTIVARQPILTTIPYWLTREDYDKPKPAPDGYLKAINKYSSGLEKIIGFEDSERGLISLMATPAVPVLINALDADLCAKWQSKGVVTVKSFSDLLVDI